MLVLLPNTPADIEPGEVSHRKRSHRKAKSVDRTIDILRKRTLLNQELGFTSVWMQHSIPDKATTISNHHTDFSQSLRKPHRSSDDGVARCFAANHFQQSHHVCRAEIMMTNYPFRSLRCRCDLVDVQRGCVRRQDRIRF